ncbi:hypothetical protein ACFWUQ_23560 [Streptomyces sp. NPDC058662]|uniref:hypothetical protein n=1 Tax=Streptomyces sp. NPDC058662 TaxID=3346583 RepID=UPI00365A8658
MNSAPYLLHEDRAEFERLLDEALRLRTAGERPDLAAAGQRLNAEQLRALTLNATAFVTAAAAAEYAHYVKVREELRESVSSRSASAAANRPARAGLRHRLGAAVLGAGQAGGRRVSDGVAPSRWVEMSYGRRLLAALLGLHVRPVAPTPRVAPAARTASPARMAPGAPGTQSPRTPGRSADARTRLGGLVTPARETAGPTGAGLRTVVAVLAPVVSGAAAALCFLGGFILTALAAESGVGRAMYAAGWLFAAVAVGAVVVCVVGLLVVAQRAGRGAVAPEDAYAHELSDEQARAREAWRRALLERGIEPFLRDALASDQDPRHPDASAPGRRLTSPDFTSPDFGGPERRPD